MPAAEATIEATAQGIASMLCAHGPEVEWRICTIWEAAYGLILLSSSAVDLPEIVVATPLQPPLLSWNLYIPLLKVLEYLPRGSPSEACLMKIFVATVEAVLQRTFLFEISLEENRKSRYNSEGGPSTKNLAVTELRTMVHSLFLESCATEELASRLLFVVLTVCVSHEAQTNGNNSRAEDNYADCRAGYSDSSESIPSTSKDSRKSRQSKRKKVKKQGPVVAFDSYVLAAGCALACELQLFPLVANVSNPSSSKTSAEVMSVKLNGSSNEFKDGIDSAIRHTRRILAILEALFSLKPSTIGTSWGYSSNEIVAAAMVAAHISELFRRSKVCMNSLSILMRCKWDNEIYNRASSLNIIDIHRKEVASIANKAEPLEAHLSHTPVWRDTSGVTNGRTCNEFNGTVCFQSEVPSTLTCEDHSHSKNLRNCGKALYSFNDDVNTAGKRVANFQFDASDLAHFLTMDRLIGFSCSVQIFLQSVLEEKQELLSCFTSLAQVDCIT